MMKVNREFRYNSVLKFVKEKRIVDYKDTKMKKAAKELFDTIESDIIERERIQKGMIVNLLV